MARSNVEARLDRHALLAVSVASEPEIGEFARSIEDSTEGRAVGPQAVGQSPVEIKPVAVSRPVLERTAYEDAAKAPETLPNVQRAPTEGSPEAQSGELSVT